MKITVLGTGFMGYPMARRLCETGHHVHVWNRSRDKAGRLEPMGATVHDSPGAAVAGADTVISMLESGSVVASVLFDQGAAAAMKPGTLVIDMASIKPAEARDHAARLTAI